MCLRFCQHSFLPALPGRELGLCSIESNLNSIDRALLRLAPTGLLLDEATSTKALGDEIPFTKSFDESESSFQ